MSRTPIEESAKVPPPSPTPGLGTRGHNRYVARALHIDFLGILAVYVAMCVLLSLASRDFLTSANISNLLQEMSVVWIIAIGQTFVILNKEIDLSVGSIAALTSILAALASQHGWPEIGVILVAFAVGGAFGLVNGFLVAKGRVSSLVVTLGTMTAGLGLALVFTGGAPESISNGFLEEIGQNGIGIFSYQFIIALVVSIVAALVLRYTVFGRSVYASGDNQDAARLNGINVGAVTISTFVITGFLCALAGLLLAGQFATADPTIGTNLNLQSIAAVVIGGTSLFGGVGGIPGTVLGSALLATLSNGLVHFNVQSAWQEVVTGGVIVAAVLLDQLRRRRRH
jgi:ribose/xylose/arabinose/galactoside ABC-type transport system permease subunit